MIVPLAVANLFCLVLGYLYPAYASFKTLDAPAHDREQSRRWLVYWVVISAFGAVELLGDSFLFWFPFYYECKMAFIAWLVLPYFNGSAIIYHRYIEKLLEKYYPHIDSRVETARAAVTDALGTATQAGMKYVRSKSVHIISNFANQQSEGDNGNGSGDAAAVGTTAPGTAAASTAAPGAPAAEGDTKLD